MHLVVRNTWRWLSLRRWWCACVALVVAVATVGCAQVCRSVVDGREVPCPLSREDLRKVTAWMAGEVARDRQPFCWRHSYINLLGHCRKGFNPVWPVCWERCAAGRANCAAGCASSGAACGAETWNMVKESLLLGVNVASLGRASTATQAAKLARVKGLVKAGSKAERNQHRIELQLSTADWVKEAVGDFGSLTTPEVDRELKQNFSGDDLRWVQEQYALHHLALVLESEGGPGARDILADIAPFDPTGVTAVVDAFSQPMCRAPLPFPAIKLRRHDGGAPPQQVCFSGSHD